jgi:hypothetical protein
MPLRVVRVGDLGTALTPMAPSGLVGHDGLRLDARSDGAFIPAGASVVVLRGDPTGYVVREVGPDAPIPVLHDAGAEATRPEFMRNTAEVRVAAARSEAELRRAWAKGDRWRSGAATLLGGLGGLGDSVLAFGDDSTPAGAAGGLLVGLVLALAVNRAGRLLAWSPLAAGGAIAGGLLGAEAAFWAAVAAGDAVPLWAAVPAGALVGTAAGGWAGRNVDAPAGPGSAD